MSHFGKKLAVFGIWAGIGILVGMQLGGTGGNSSTPVPGWSVISGTAVNNAPAAGAQSTAVTGYQVQSDGKGGYVYVPVTLVPSVSGSGQTIYVQQPSGSGQAAIQQPAQGSSSIGTVPQQPVQGSGSAGTVPQQPVQGSSSNRSVQQQPAQRSSSADMLPQQPAVSPSTLTPGQILVPNQQEPAIDELADKTAGMLQNASRKGIRWVVSLFDSSGQP
ncbi:hypothetical protein KIH86_15185 [Paenibacillus sp. HN-1]|uniref:hypothetical protein n=1 Tax=Paenibacillus TaxID=44249 RepID=UPI001CA999D1|nr:MULTISPECIES: hypothetical protein [Paenibacillus]MBY9079484.1 hypothetical protein [Paenibacillus sp. CGMCC 1.18879]MBY9085573.1 hypothetical protein [Paenibacillus sinensis]